MTWLKIKEVAERLGVSEERIRVRADCYRKLGYDINQIKKYPNAPKKSVVLFNYEILSKRPIKDNFEIYTTTDDICKLFDFMEENNISKAAVCKKLSCTTANFYTLWYNTRIKWELLNRYWDAAREVKAEIDRSKELNVFQKYDYKGYCI